MKKTAILFVMVPAGTGDLRDFFKSLVCASIMKQMKKVIQEGTGERSTSREFDNLVVVVGTELPKDVSGATVYNVTEDLLPYYAKKGTTLLSIAQWVAGEAGASTGARKNLASSQVFIGWATVATARDLITYLVKNSDFIVVDEDPFSSTTDFTEDLILGQNIAIEDLGGGFGYVKTTSPVSSLSAAATVAKKSNLVVDTETRCLGCSERVLVLPGNKSFEDNVVSRTGLSVITTGGTRVLAGEIAEDLLNELSIVTENDSVTDVVTPQAVLERMQVLA